MRPAKQQSPSCHTETALLYHARRPHEGPVRTSETFKTPTATQRVAALGFGSLAALAHRGPIRPPCASGPTPRHVERLSLVSNDRYPICSSTMRHVCGENAYGGPPYIVPFLRKVASFVK